jgi:transcriptional regulator with XRE-family HTH domain
VGEGLRAARLAARLSQAEVAHRSGVARSNIAAIESGARSPSPEMTGRLLDAIRGRDGVRSELHLSPPVLLNIELSRVAAFNIMTDPDAARQRMAERLMFLRSADDGGAAYWLNYWDGLLQRWDVGEVVRLLLSTDPDDVESRKVSPISAVISADEEGAALDRAKLVWRATR